MRKADGSVLGRIEFGRIFGRETFGLLNLSHFLFGECALVDQ